MNKYTLISNSCSSMFVYLEIFATKNPYFIDYNNPFISTWIPDDEQYVRFCENYNYYISVNPRLDEPINSKWEKQNGHKRMPSPSEPPYYPVMFLDDIEIHWAHDREHSDAVSTREKKVLLKYRERLKISKAYEPIFLWCYHEMYLDHSDEERSELVKRFCNIPQKTIYLTNIQQEEELTNKNTIVKFIPHWENSRKGNYAQNENGKIFLELISQFD